MIKESLTPIKKAMLTNNCPECFNGKLTLTFYQKISEGILFKKLHSTIISKIVCNTCKSIIYPVKWTEDIERVVEYYQKTLMPIKGKIKFTGLFYIIVLTALATVIAVIASLQYAEII